MPLFTRTIQAHSESSLITQKKIDQKDHTVIPVVALVEGVIQCATCPDPEFVSANEFGKVEEMWNGRPVTIDHPKRNGNFVSANSIDVRENETIGWIYNAKVEDGKLKVEAWIDNEKANETEEGKEFIRMAEAGEQIEVSTGYFAEVKPFSGSHEGKAFSGVQTDLKPDHLAFLVDSQGACNWEMGCGAPRLNVNCECGGTCDTCKTKGGDLFNFGSFIFNGALSDVDKRKALEAALSKKFDEDFFFVMAVFDDFAVVERGFSNKLSSVGFSIAEDGSITLDDEFKEVRPVTEFVPVVVNEGEPTMSRENTIKLLVESEATRFTEDDKEFLEGLTDDQLQKLTPMEEPTEEEDEENKPTIVNSDDKVVTINVGGSAKILKDGESVTDDKGNLGKKLRNLSTKAPTAQEYIDEAPPEIREVLNRGLNMTKAERSQLVSLIKDNTELSEEELQGMSLEVLQKLAKGYSNTEEDVNYSVMVGNRIVPVSNSDDDKIPPAPLAFEKKGA